MEEKIAVIVLNYKNLRDTINCVKSLSVSDGGSMCDYFVVDNSLEPKNSAELRQAIPNVQYLPSPGNGGFAKGNNLGLRKAIQLGYKTFLIINPDVRVPKKFFKPLLRHFSNKSVGIVAPTTAHFQKNLPFYGLEGSVDWRLAKPSHRNLLQLTEKKPIFSQFVTFACVLLNLSTLNKVGFIDERFFMYFEDVDYCLMAHQKGIKIVLDPTVIVSHQTSSSFSKPTKKLGLSFQSHLRFIFKWLPLWKTVLPLLYVFVSYPYLYILWTYHGLKYKSR